MTSQFAELSDDETFYAYLPEYLDEQLDKNDRDKFQEIVVRKGWGQLIEDYADARGHFQLALQDLFVDDHLIHELHVMVEDDAERANHEAADIDDYSKAETKGALFRGLTILLMILFIGGATYFFLAPESKPPFSALDSLLYESIVLVEDPEGRLDFPTNSMSDLLDYFQRYPDLGVDVAGLNSPGSQWLLEGGAVIDYDVQKIVAVQFSKILEEESLIIYLFAGDMKDFPKSEPGTYKELTYQAYSSEYFNVVVWPIKEGSLGMILGGGTPQELSELAYQVIRQN